MTTTIEILDAAKRATGCETDYQFMKRFSIKQSTMSNWRTGNRSLDDRHAAMMAEILGREPGEVMALCAAERAKDTKSRARWLHVAALLATIGLPPAHGGQFDHNGPQPAKNNAQTDNYAHWRDALARFLFGDWLRLA